MATVFVRIGLIKPRSHAESCDDSRRQRRIRCQNPRPTGADGVRRLGGNDGTCLLTHALPADVFSCTYRPNRRLRCWYARMRCFGLRATVPGSSEKNIRGSARRHRRALHLCASPRRAARANSGAFRGRRTGANEDESQKRKDQAPNNRHQGVGDAGTRKLRSPSRPTLTP